MTTTLILGILIGTVLGLTGAGGAILSVPALVFSLGWTMQQAAPVALTGVAVGATIGTIEGLRHGLVRYRAALLMAAVGMLLTPLGLRIAQALPQTALQILFAIVMLFVAARQFRKDNDTTGELTTWRNAGRLNPDTKRFKWNWPTTVLLGAIGAVTGFMAGLLGVGGGFVMVPLLRRFTEVSVHGIVSTALMVTALVSVAAVGGALLQGAQLPRDITILFAGAIAIGMFGGRLLSKNVSARHVQLGFASLLVLVACGLLVKALG